jgi:hypothetical protein
VPTFCRHNRFIERCPICSKTLADSPSSGKARSRSPRQARSASAGGQGVAAGRSPRAPHDRRARREEQLRVRRELRAPDDGYRNPLVPGLRANSDAASLAEEIAFASGRLARLRADPPDLFAEIRALAGHGELERATWICFLTVYLSPLQDEQPFAGIRLALARGDLPSLEGVPLGPRTSYEQARGAETLLAYRQWVERCGHGSGAAAGNGEAAQAFVGEESWTAERRFERIFERLALPGFGRMGRYELLVTLGHLGLYELRAGSLLLAPGGAGAPDDLTTMAAKRIFGIGEAIYLDRRVLAFAEALSVPLEALDLAFANWSVRERATLGIGSDALDAGAHDRARAALEL